MLRRLFVPAILVVALAAGHAQAGLLSLDYQGLSSTDSTLAGAPIPLGTPFELQAIFSSTPSMILGQGEATYTPIAINVEIGGTPYSALVPGELVIGLTDPSSPVGPFYVAGLEGFAAFFPKYTTATPPLSGTAPSPTVYSGYLGDLGPAALGFNLSDGENLFLTYDKTVGISASLTPATVPEPASLTLVLLGGASLAATTLVRRRGAAASA